MPHNITSRPLAAPGLLSYRCANPYGWTMIGALSDDDALHQARCSSAGARREDLQRWDGAEYVDCSVLDLQRKLLADSGYTIQSSGPACWWALRPGETKFQDDGAGKQNYLGFFGCDASLLREVAALVKGEQLPDQTWLVVYGTGGCWSGYPEATVIAAPDKGAAMKSACRIAVRELADGPRGGISIDVELVTTGVKETALYASRLLASARAMADAHWEIRDAIIQHWRQVLRRPAVSDADLKEDRARALGFKSLAEWRSVEARRLDWAAEGAAQVQAEAAQYREVAAAPEAGRSDELEADPGEPIALRMRG